MASLANAMFFAGYLYKTWYVQFRLSFRNDERKKVIDRQVPQKGSRCLGLANPSDMLGKASSGGRAGRPRSLKWVTHALCHAQTVEISLNMARQAPKNVAKGSARHCDMQALGDFKHTIYYQRIATAMWYIVEWESRLDVIMGC